METATLTRRERERLLRRKAMLDAARAVFAEKGFREATLDEIAERAEFGKGTLYNYFKSKEDLLFAIFDEMYDTVMSLAEPFFEEEAADRPVRAVFRDLFAALIGHFKLNEEEFALTIREAHRLVFDDERKNVAYFVEQRERLIRLMTPALERAVERGELRPFPPHALAHMIMGNVNGYLMFDCIDEARSPGDARPTLSPDEAADFLATILFDGLQAPTTTQNGH